MTVTSSFHVNDSYYDATLSNIDELTFNITVRNVTPLSQIYFAFDFRFSDDANSNGYTGLQPLSNLAGGGQAPALNFSVWNSSGGTAGAGSTIEPFVETGTGTRITHPEAVTSGVSYTIDLKITNGQLIETETDASGNSIVIGSLAAPAATFTSSLAYFSEFWGSQNSATYPTGEVQISNVLVNGVANQVQPSTTTLSALDLPNDIPCLYATGPGGYYDTSIGPAGAHLTLTLQSGHAAVSGATNINTVIIGAGYNDLTGDSFNNIQWIDGGGQTLTLTAAEAAQHMNFRNASLTISDTAEDVATHLGSLQALAAAGSAVTIVLTDQGTPTLQLTAEQEANDAAALHAIATPYSLSTVSARPDIAAVSAITANQNQTITLSGSDFGVQAAYVGASSTIKIEDISNSWDAGWTSDWITLSVSSWSDTAITLSGFSGVYGPVYGMLHEGDLLGITLWNPQNGVQSQTVYVTVSTGGETASQALQTYATGTAASPIQVADSAAAFQADLAPLQAMAAAGMLGSVTLTDFGTPNLALSAALLTADSAALAEIASAYTLTVSGVTVANAAEIAQQGHVLAVSVSDSGINISSNLDSLNALAAAGAVTTITPTDSGGAVLSVTAAQLSSDSAALGVLSGSYQLTIDASLPNLTIDGIAGHGDTAIFSGTASQYAIAGAGTGLTVTSGSSTDHLDNITALRFSDYTDIVAASPGQGTVTTGNVTELYAAVFARLPDVGGLVFYQNYLAAHPGTSLLTFSQWFLSSPEYTSNSAHAYAQTIAGDTQFITDSYQNLLHRSPSADEINFYLTKVLEQPESQLQTHAQMLVYFSASAEFLGDVQVTTQTPSDAHHWLILI